jgi:hypothetical protein
MPRANKVITNMVGGEISPQMYGRVDAPIYQKALAKMENFIAMPQGCGQYRNGTVFVTNTRLNQLAALIPFQFSDAQSYIIEATPGYFRFYTNSGIVALPGVGITGITNAFEAIVTAPSHGYTSGDAIFISGSGTMLLDGQQFLVVYIDANHFAITDLFSNPINTLGVPSFTGSPYASQIYEIPTPYTINEIFNLQFAQSADTMYVVHQNHPPMKLVRSGGTSWSLATFTRTGTDPFPSAGNYPRSVQFDAAGRLWYGGTENNPQTLWGSSAPSSGSTAFDDFTFGTSATNAVEFTLAPLFTGHVDYVEWISNTNQFMVIGTFGSLRTLDGGGIGIPVTPTSITALPANEFGCEYALPVANGESLFFIQRAGQRVRSLEYDFYIQGFTTRDQTLVADHLTEIGLSQIVQQRGFPDVMWAVRADGKFLGFTYSRPEIENYACWHRHYLGGDYIDANSIVIPFAKVNSIQVATRNQTSDQLWFSVTRSILGAVVNSVEYMADYQPYPNYHDFYTGDSVNDPIRFQNALYATQMNAVYLDMANLYDGTDLGFNAGATITPSAVSGNGISVFSNTNVFPDYIVGQEIHKQYDLNGNGGGRAIIIGVIGPTEIIVNITVPFDNVNPMLPGSWYVTTTSVAGLHLFEGVTLAVTVDGGPALTSIVQNGQITLEAPACTVVVGFPYTGTIETLNLDIGGKLGTAQSKPRALIKSAIRFLNAGGTQFGTDYYSLKQLTFRPQGALLDRPVPLFSGIKMVQYLDSWSDQQNDPEKKVVIIQNLPLPCTVSGIDNYLNTTDE